jgi:hypothetical protein
MNESARDFAQRVAGSLSELSASGARVHRTSLQLSTAQGDLATARRFSLARVLLAQSPESDELLLGGPLADSEQGRLDLAALAETLEPQLWGSKTSVRSVGHRRSAHVGSVPGTARAMSDDKTFVWPRAA